MPLNDLFLNFDVLATLDPTNFGVTGESHYAEMVREARRQRRLVDGRLTDWIVVRNRLSALGSRNKRLVGEGLTELSERMGFRTVEGFAERVLYREFFPRGLTALDDLDKTTPGTRPNMSHVTAREEVVALLNTLRLPLSENGKRRAAARAEWYSARTSRFKSTTSSAKPFPIPAIAPERGHGHLRARRRASRCAARPPQIGVKSSHEQADQESFP